ncbi:Hypothetical predicted protein, partial [Marmota monax]
MDGTCVGTIQLCDGAWDCPDGTDEGPGYCPLPSLPVPPAGTLPGPSTGSLEGASSPLGSASPARSCGPLEFLCGSGECTPRGWRCDQEEDCADGSDELGCGGPCALHHAPCARGPHCVSPGELCDGVPQCPDGSDEGPDACGLLVLQHCPGPAHQSQACFTKACPVDGEWSSWSSWSLCSEPCGGTRTRQRQCHPPQNGGQACALLPGGPHSTRQTGCWCPEGQVLGSEGQCVWPRQCPCLVDGARYWPGQHIKANCQLCVCQDGRPRRCRPNPDCAINCGWSSWSPWAECLGPCGSQSIQWSFRSPNNPRLSGRGRQCRGIHRKARRCQTQPCEGCEQQGHTHQVGERWRGGPCRVCQCLHMGTVHCSPYCPLGSCPQGWILVEGVGESCCHCALPAENQTVPPTATPAPAPAPSPQTGPPLATYVLPPPG